MLWETNPFSKFLMLLYKDAENRIGAMIFLFEFSVMKNYGKGKRLSRQDKIFKFII